MGDSKVSEKRAETGLLARWTRPLKRLFGAKEAAPASDAGHFAHPEERLTEDGFQLAVDSMLSDEVGRFQTNLQVISLIEFHEAVGDRWGKVAEKVMLIAEGVIHRYLGPGNIFSRQGRDLFVLMFRNCPQSEGRRRAQTIAKELGTRLMGDQFLGLDRPLALAAELPLAAAVNEDGTLNLAVIHNTVGAARAEIAAAKAKEAEALRLSMLPSRPIEAADDVLRHSMLPGFREVDPLADELRYHMVPDGEGPPPPDIEVHHSRLPGKLPDPEPLVIRPEILPGHEAPPPDLGPDPGWGMTGDAERAKIDPKWRELAHEAVRPKGTPHWMTLERPADKTKGPVGGPPPLPPEASLKLQWRPIWVSVAEAIAAYGAHVQRFDSEGAVPLEGSNAYPWGGGPSAATLDRFTAAGTVREMGTVEGTTNRYTVVVPLHWSSASSASRMTVTAPLADLGETVRSSRVVIDLFGLPAEVSQRDLETTVRALKPLCHEVALRVPLNPAYAAMASDCGAGMIGFDLAELPPRLTADEDRMLAGLMLFQEAAARSNSRAFVWGLRRRRLVVEAVKAGYAMVNGPALMKDLARPAKILPAPKDRFV